MKTLLTICIPTYKRPITLRRCIDSLVEQIEKYTHSDCVNIYVANDASPDDETEIVLQSYEKLSYFNSVTREQNLGMNVNIKYMLNEIAQKSFFQLIITDDDFLQPDVLDEIVEFLKTKQQSEDCVCAIWTPRYSYIEDGELSCIACSPFKQSFMVKSSAFNTGRYMRNGFILSGLIVKAEYIDFEFWDRYSINAFFPVLFFGDLLLKTGAYFWDRNIVHHTVLNKCHWEDWGKNDIVISLRLFSDYIDTYNIMAKRIRINSSAFMFKIGALRNIYFLINRQFSSDKLRGSRVEVFEAINELKKDGFLSFNIQSKLVMFPSAILIATMSFMKFMKFHILSFLLQYGEKRELYRISKQEYWEKLQITPVVVKLIF